VPQTDGALTGRAVFCYNQGMPIFEYACETCNHRFEKLVFGSTEGIRCPSCEGEKLRKLFSVFASVTSDSSPSYDCMPSFGEGACGRCGSTERRCE
jgi:putative FmdB family regulatory protein